MSEAEISRPILPDRMNPAELIQSLALKMKNLGDETKKTPEQDQQEFKLLRGELEAGESKVNLKDADKLWVAVGILYPARKEADMVYGVIRSAQIEALGGTVPKGWDSRKIHEEWRKNPGLLNNLNGRQIIYGENAVLKLLNDEITLPSKEKPILTPKMLESFFPSVDQEKAPAAEVTPLTLPDPYQVQP